TSSAIAALGRGLAGIAGDSLRAPARGEPAFPGSYRPARRVRVTLHRFLEAALRAGYGRDGKPPYLGRRPEIERHLGRDRYLGTEEGVRGECRGIPAVADRQVSGLVELDALLEEPRWRRAGVKHDLHRVCRRLQAHVEGAACPAGEL